MSGFGLEIFDAAGIKRFDHTFRYVRHLACISASPGASGSYAIPAEYQSAQIAYWCEPKYGSYADIFYVGHNVYRSGNTIYWTPPAAEGDGSNSYIVIVVYT